MSETELSKALKDLPNRILNVPIEERKPLIQNVINVLDNPGINSAVIKALCKVLATTITRYKDAQSQQLIENLIVNLLKKHHDAAVEHLMNVFKVLITKELPNAPAQKGAEAAIIALRWTALVIKNAEPESNVTKTEKSRLLEYQISLLPIIFSVSNDFILEDTEDIFFDLWSDKCCFDEILRFLDRKEPSSSTVLAFILLLCFESEKEDDDFRQKQKDKILQHFIQGIITSKTKLNPSIILQCRPLLEHVTKSEFEEKLLPPILRAILRSPEIALQTVGVILSEMNFDCSDYTVKIGKLLIQHLYSKDENARNESVESLKQLSLKCSQPQPIEELLTTIFALLGGSEGKITIVEYRVNLLQGIGNLSFNKVPMEEITTTSNLVIKLFSKLLETEVQEKVICHALETFSLWSLKLNGKLPKEITDIFKKGLDLKSTTAAVRLSYLQWLLHCLHNSSLSDASNITGFLIKTFEAAIQNSVQMPALSEGLCASCIILKIENDQSNQKLQNFWNVIFDLNKNPFFSDRFLSSASPDILSYVFMMAERLLTSFRAQIKGSLDVLFKTIVFCLKMNHPKIKFFCLPLLQSILEKKDGIIYANEIISEMRRQIEKINDDSESMTESSKSSHYIEIVKKLCTFKETSMIDSQSLAQNLLLLCHHPMIYNQDTKVWEEILQQLDIEPKQFIAVNRNFINEQIIGDFKPSSTFQNALSTIVRISPSTMTLIVDKVISSLSDPQISEVTDDEYFIFLTPDGELYDKSVVPNNEEIYATSRLKRENKVYSYKEQLEELQLRRELDEKRRKEGKFKPPQLTPKQQESIKNQLEKEKQIRVRLTALNDKLLNIVAMIEAACAGNAVYFSLNYPVVLEFILKNMNSPLAAGKLCDLYFKLNTFCFTGDITSLGKKVAISTIRLNKPRCDLKEEWLQEELNKSVVDTFTNLQKFAEQLCCDDEEEESNASFLSCPAFCYVLEFFKLAFKERYIITNEEYLIYGMNFIEVHSKMRQDNSKPVSMDPNYMPRREMLRLLMNFVDSFQGRIQSQAMNTLLSVAEMNSGEEDCAEAGVSEIRLLLESLEKRAETTRDAALRALIIIVPALRKHLYDEDLEDILVRNIWISKHDVSAENRRLAEELWEKLVLDPPEIEDVMNLITHKELPIQKASANALVPLLNENKDSINTILKKVVAIYNEKLIKIPAKLDQFDREIEPAIDQWEARRGVAIAIREIAQFFRPEEVDHVMQFMVSQGLGDREEIVHKEMLAAALHVVDLHGKETIVNLLPVFEDFLDKAPKSQTFDNIRQAVVILMGSLARHLEKDDKRIEPIVRRLLSALTTPSQQVQEAVANCLPHLMPAVKDEAPALVKKLLHQLVKSDKYGERRGAAYGIAGVVKGLGILSLKQLDIMSKLTTYIQEKKNYKSREGALFAFEVLCTNLGRLFEPYIVHVLPYLLQCFGDSSVYVRQAADETAKVVMGKLSAHGVKLVLPALLDALDEDSWRTKTASVELLGAMAFCAPKQLSSCLPNIVPKLIEVLGDSHTKVQEAGADALKLIGSVIKNPEIQAIVPTLLKALEDPSRNTSVCLQCLLETKFVHFIDAPSLALIMPVVQRAFMDRSTETRKMAAQIIGNMYSLTDQKDLTPYLPSIIPGLKQSLLDPVPEVRAVSARALGAMVRGMGETSFEDLLPWLMQTLTSESSSVDRSGAAQGLSEVVGGLGVEKLHKLMPEIISTAERSDIAPHVKDGYIMMFIYMPAAFPQEFTPYIGQIITPILKALADENEFVRDTALKAGQRIVNMYAESAVALLLPELEKGLFDDNWRIRFSSVQLLGDLLYRISGVSGKMTTETANDDDNFGTEQSHTAIISFLGEERRNRVLSGLYMGRSDVSLMVRQAALHVWKVVVTNTPRTLREILPTLFGLLLGCLASTSYDKRQVAARTLGDLVRKLGERVLPEIIPILEKGLNSEHPDQRQGVCIGLSEIMASTSKEMVLTFVNSLVPTVRKALSDPLPEVREAAAKTFESLHSTVGSKALDDILPSMLESLSDPDPQIAENTLDGLRQVMTIKSRVVLPYLVPQLTVQPVNTKALSILVSVAGDALTKYLPKILSALLQALAEAQGTSNEQQELEYCQAVILSVTDEAGIRIIMDTLMSSALVENVATKKSVSSLLCAFCMHSPGDYSQYVPQLLRCLLRLMADSDKDILQRSWDALNAVVKNMDSAQQIAHVSDVRQAVRFAASDLHGAELPGFCLPKGITPLLPVFREAILNGLPDEKENAAQGLGEVIYLTSSQALQPSVVHITGPLIRILGDRFNANVKAAVLETLAILLKKVGTMLKQFLPQLQTTFLKALYDPNRTVRMKAGYALSELVKIHTRADPLFNEIHNGIKNVDDSPTRETMLQALRNLISSAGEKMSDPIKKQLVTTLVGMLSYSEDISRNCASGCLGALLTYLTNEQVDDILNNHLFVNDSDDSPTKHGRSALLFVALKASPEKMFRDNIEDKINNTISGLLQSEKIPLACNGVRALTYSLQYKLLNDVTPSQTLVVTFTRAMNHNSNEVKQLVAKSCSHLAKVLGPEKIPLGTLKTLIPMLVNGTKEKNGYVKSNAELALIALLRLRDNDKMYTQLSEILESGARESLSEVVSKVLRKAISLPVGKEEELDDTLLS